MLLIVRIPQSQDDEDGVDEVIEFESVEPESIAPQPKSDDASMEQVEFVPITTEGDAVSTPSPDLPIPEEVESIEFALDIKKAPDVVEQEPEDGESILEIDSALQQEKEPEDDELVLEIGYDLEDLTDSDPQKK